MPVARGEAVGCVVPIALALVLAGCTSVTIVGEAKVEQSGYLGGVSIQPVSSQPVRVRISGLGVTQTHSGLSIGWVAEDTVILGAQDACRVVVIVDSFPKVEAARDWLNSQLSKEGNPCIAK
jgi:hypothetical protein